jgi:hypothetical protein
MSMNVRARSLLIATVVCSLALASIPSLTPATNATLSPDDEVSTPQVWCVENSQGSSDWTDGCLRGEKFCMDEFPYAPAPGNDNKYREGYIAGWEHAGCTSQK